MTPARSVTVLPKTVNDIFREAWEHTSLHDLASSDEYRFLPTGAQADKLDTWCRMTIGKDYLALGQNDRERLVNDLQDEFRASSQIASLNPESSRESPDPLASVPAITGLGEGKSAASSQPPNASIAKPLAGLPTQTSPSASPVPSQGGQVSPQVNGPIPSTNPSPATNAPAGPVAQNAPIEGSSTYEYPEQQAHDLDDLDVLRSLHFKPYGPPRIEPGGVRVYTGPSGTVRIR